MAAPAATPRRRVVHITTAHPADDVRIFDRECRSLAQSGLCDVHLAAAGTIPPGSGVSLIPLRPAPVFRLGRFTSGPQRAMRIARSVDAELWHFHDPELLPVALYQALAGRTVVWDAHEDYVDQFTSLGGNKAWVPRPMRGVVRDGMAGMLRAIDSQAAAVVAATPTIAARYSNPRTVVVGNEARIEDFLMCQPDFFARRILFTGHVGATHLFPQVVQALESLPNVTLAVAGRSPDGQLWEAAASRLGPRVTHLGWLDRPRLAHEISKSTLGLSTYADLPPYAVAAPTKLFEFSAAGLPTIASPNPSNARLIAQGAGGFLADGFTSGALRAAMEAALTDEATWVQASELGRAWAAREGSWAASEARLIDVYQRVLDTQ